MFTSPTDIIVFALVVGARLILPLFIPYYPLPFILVCLVLDGIDQTVFQTFTKMDLTGYQSYDKAMDIYYLVIAYLSTLRNWTNYWAFNISQFLLYYRLIGVAAFEFSQWRPMLLIFPNTFEYFFIFYEFIRLRWDPRRFGKRFLIGAAAAIWIFIKLPQEYWIHIAQMDTTDFIKERVFGVPLDTGWGELLRTQPLPFLAAGLAIAGAAALFWWLWTKKLPAADWSLDFRGDAHQEPLTHAQLRSAQAEEDRTIFDVDLLEKVVLLTLVTAIFARILPGIHRTGLLTVGLAVAWVVSASTIVGTLLSRRGTTWRSTLVEFLVMAAVNLGAFALYSIARSGFDFSMGLFNTLFFTFLVTIIATLYDHYKLRYLARRPRRADFGVR